MQSPARRLNPDLQVPAADSLGLAYLARATADPERLQPLFNGLVAQASAEPGDPGALMDVATLLLATGQREKGLEIQASAIAAERCYRRRAPAGEATLRLLAFMIPGDFQANTPLDFLLEDSRVELISCYLDGPTPPEALPAHDVAFLAVGQSDEAAPLLARLRGAFDAWPVPVLNNRPEVIAGLSRDGVAARFAGHPKVLCPTARRVGASALAKVALGTQPLSALDEGLAFPVIVRPVGSQAGQQLERIADRAELGMYLTRNAGAAEFYVTAYLDYAGADGLYRKLRVVFIKGRPFLSHMAVSERWMVHYLNADMHESAAKRAEEAEMMATFDEGFSARHAEAFAALCEAFPLDYFGIDCAETPDGRLVVFETDVAMIVHAMDPEGLFPYKKPAMAKIFAAFVDMLQQARG